MTTRLAAKIAGLAQVLLIKHVAAWFCVGWDTVTQIDLRALARRPGRMEDQLDGFTQLAVDEFAIEKGYRYVSIVLDVPTKRVVWLVRGRGDDALASFVTALGPARRWWQHWRRRARANRLAPLQRVVTTLERHLHGIHAHCRNPLLTGILEGYNNKIKGFKRMAHG